MNAQSHVYMQDGDTPLLYASSEGHMAMVELLVEKGGNMEKRDQVITC
jgi:ankyrin repeat protein